MLLSGVALRKDKFSHKIRTIAFIRIGENVFVFPWHLLFFFFYINQPSLHLLHVVMMQFMLFRHKPTGLALASRGGDVAVYVFDVNQPCLHLLHVVGMLRFMFFDIKQPSLHLLHVVGMLRFIFLT